MKQITTLTAISLIFLASSSFAQGTFAWATRMGGTDYDWVQSIAVDASGNVYSTGPFYGTADFDPGFGTYNLTSAGLYDFFISKQNAYGQLLWAIRLGGGQTDWSNDIKIDALGNIFITGRFGGTVDFAPGQAVYNLTSFGGDDIFILKLNANGNLVWAKRMGGVGNDYGNCIALDNAGNVYTAGYFTNAVDFDPSPMLFSLVSMGGNDFFVSKLDAGGNFEWARSIGGTENDDAKGIVADDLQNVYITGIYQDTVDFNPGQDTFNLAVNGLVDFFILKLDVNGNFTWVKSIGGTSADYSKSLALDQDGHIYLCGSFNASVDFDPGPNIYNLYSAGVTDIFVSKLDTSGNFVWAKSIGSGYNESANSLASDAYGNVYVTGQFNSSSCDFDPGPGIFTLDHSGQGDVYLFKLDRNGIFRWAKKAGGSNLDNGYDIAVDATGNVYSTGIFGATVDFDPGQGLFMLTSAGHFDVFQIKLRDIDLGDGHCLGVEAPVRVPTNRHVTLPMVNGEENDDMDTPIALASSSAFAQPPIPHLYPNPTTGTFTLALQAPAQISLFNTLGEKVYQAQVLENVSQHDLGGLVNGVYYLQVASGQGVGCEKVMIVR